MSYWFQWSVSVCDMFNIIKKTYPTGFTGLFLGVILLLGMSYWFHWSVSVSGCDMIIEHVLLVSLVSFCFWV